MVICCDTSFLFSLYGNDTNTPRALRWVRTKALPITLTALNEFELSNALRFAEFRKTIGAGRAASYLAQFEADLDAGRLRSVPCNLADVVREAMRLSEAHTISAGHRAFDILHVAGALCLGASDFLTFDDNQRRLAKAAGLQSSLRK